MQKREIKLGDVFSYGVDKLIINELKYAATDYHYHHYTKKKKCLLFANLAVV